MLSLRLPKRFRREISPTLGIDQSMLAKEDSGDRVFKLGFGCSPIPPTREMLESFADSAGLTNYPPVQGDRELRESIAGFYEREYTLNLDPGRIFIYPGSKEAIFQILSLISGPVLLPSPSWVSYAPQADILDRTTVWLPTEFRTGYKLTPETLSGALKALSFDEPKILILNSPNNPTGQIYTRAELEGLAVVCRQHRVLVLHDFIYGFPCDFDGEPTLTMAHIMPESTIMTAGLSKIFGAGGWRLGFVALPKDSSWDSVARGMNFFMSETISGVNFPTQRAAISAYNETYSKRGYLAKANSIHKVATRYVSDRLNQLGVPCPVPRGGFYVFPHFTPFKKELAFAGVRTGCDLAASLRKIGFYALQGESFGLRGEDLALRIACVDYDGPSALESLPPGFDKTNKGEPKWVLENMPKLAEACDVLEQFVKNGLSREAGFPAALH